MIHVKTNIKFAVVFAFSNMLFANPLLSQRTVDFSANHTNGCSPMVVQFYNLSSGFTNPNFLWELGNGNTSTLEHPQTIYTQPGNYTIKLTVTDNAGSQVAEKINFIKVHQKPQAKFSTLNDSSGCTPFNANFMDNSIPGGAAIVSRIWYFGDGDSSYLQNPNHTYHNAGNYNVSLRINDVNGCLNQITKPSHITSLPLPEVNFEANTTATCFDSLTVQFTSSTSSNITQYLWDLGNGNSSNTANPTTYYSGEGSYTVQLTATDNNSCVGYSSKQDYIKLININADFSLNKDTICINETLELQNNSSILASYSWDFGNGTFSNEENPVVSFADSGWYKITLIATFNDLCSDSISKNIYVEGAFADFITDKDYICQFPTTVNYISNSNNADNYLWKFHNNSTSTQPNPTVVYDTTSFFVYGVSSFLRDTLIVTTKHGCLDTIIKNNLTEVNIPLTQFDFTSEAYGCIPVEVTVKNNSYYHSAIDSIVSYNWNWGDGSSATTFEPSYTYTKPGQFEVTLTTITELGCRNSYLKIAKAGTKQNPDFNLISADTTCASNNIELKNTSSDTSLINGWLWEASDGNTYKEFEPQMYIIDTGNIDITLYAIHNGCYSQPKTKEDFVFVKGPVSIFDPLHSCYNPHKYIFLSNIIDAYEFMWDFGDGTMDSTNKYPTHIYNTRGDYQATLSSINYQNNCEYSFYKSIYVRDLKASIEADKTNVCLGDTIQFSAHNSIDVYPSIFGAESGKYKWIFDDGKELVTVRDSIKYVYDSVGNYNVKLIVKDINGCKDTTTFKLKVSAPQAGFISDAQIGCNPFKVSFLDSSNVDTTYQTFWNFGDGVYATGNNVEHIYSNNGLYSVSIKVIDEIGCVDSISKMDYIEVSKPILKFGTNDSNLCLGDTAWFTNNSEGTNLEFEWDFGDGSTSSLITPNHCYKESGIYSLQLHAIDKNGCSSNLEKTNYIYVQALPIANFTVDKSKFDCYPAMVSLTDSSISEHIVSWAWDFGDSTGGSNNQHPLHIYAKPGTYDITLKVITDIGCSDTILMKELIEVKGPYADIVAPDSICFKDSIQVKLSNPLNINNLIWDMGDGSIYNQMEVSHLYQNSGYFYPKLYLFADSLNTCDKIFTDTVYISEIRPNFQTPQKGLCLDTLIELSNSSIIKENCQWHINNQLVGTDTNLLYSFANTGFQKAKLIISSSLGCKDSVEKNIFIHELPEIQKHSDTAICKNDTIQIWAQGGISYTWNNKYYLNNNVVGTPIAFPDSSTTYTVRVLDTNGCYNIDAINVEVLPLPEYETSNDTTIIIGEEIWLNVLTNEQHDIIWKPNQWINDSTSHTILAKPEKDITYFVLIEDSNSCKNMGSINVYIDNSYSVALPDYFTPNGDGINDVIFVEGWGIKKLIYFEVYNEWGQKIFESHAINQGWDGKTNGKQAKSGTYAYKVKVEFFNNQTIEKAGTFSLLK